MVQDGTKLWSPSDELIQDANITHFMTWLNQQHGLQFDDYDTLWQWSVTEIEAFWESIAAYFDLKFSTPPTTILESRQMPGAKWFTGATLNYAEHIFRQAVEDRPMLLFQSETTPLRDISWQEMTLKTAKLAHTLRELGVSKGDRVVGFIPNIPEAMVAMLATTSLGAIWSTCSPDFGSRSVLDRFTQIEPKVLIAVDSYHYGGKRFERQDVIATLQQGLPTLEKTILISFTGAVDVTLTNIMQWDDALNNDATTIRFEQVPFEHPLWVLYSSGTTGQPKPIVHGHGGILLEHYKEVALQNNVKTGERFFWYSSTGWMMWNYLVGTLLGGAIPVVYDGSPGYPDMNVLWKLAADAGVSYFGTSAAFISACMKAEITPNQSYDLTAIRGVGSTGSPLTAEGFGWIYEHIGQELGVESLSGGTDLCTAFVSGVPLKPIHAGEIQGAALGANVQAFNNNGEAVIDEMAELVITEPMPSMPLFFWGDDDMTRYKASYFEMFPNIWRHGDWIKINERGGCVIYGRSDSTINRQGIRMGTSEIYRVVESIDGIFDSLVIDLELLGRESQLLLFVQLAKGATLSDEMKNTIKQRLKTDVSPRHVPNQYIVVKDIPYTISGKKMEVPIRRLLLGHDPKKAINQGAMRNPDALDFYLEFAKTLTVDS